MTSNVRIALGIPRHFVATTALEEFWDTAYPIVFLGPWCQRYSRRSYWEAFESTTLPSSIQDQSLVKIIGYLQEVYERLLPVLADALNDVHRLSFSTRYWRLVIGPWLLYYLHILHDKYSQIINLKQRYPDFTTLCLDERSFVVPQDTLAFVINMKGDAYNLQLYSQLFKLLGHEFPTQELSAKEEDQHKMDFYVRPKTIVNKMAGLFFNAVDRATCKRKKIIFESVYFHKPELLELVLKMKGRFWPYVAGDQVPLNISINHELRRKISSIKFGDTEYEKILMPMIGQGLPQSMLEAFSLNRAVIREKCLHPPKAIMSAIGWYFNEEFKMFAAECAEKGTKLLGVQHGGAYGLLDYFFQEEYELSITDKYFSWGWKRNGCHADIEPVSATKLVRKKNGKSDQRSEDILYVTDSSFSRFMFSYPMSTDFCKDYLDKESLFLSSLSKGVKERLVIRPHREDNGMDCKERFRDIIPDVRIETWATPFGQRDYGLLVCDHPCYATTFIESLANNKPIILFTNPHFMANGFNQQARKHWDGFKEMGIAFDDPVEAARKIDAIYKYIDDWWGEPKRQEAIKSFLSDYARVSDQWDKEWVGVLDRILDS